MAKEYETGFMEEVKSVFHDDNYDEFVKDMNDFKTCMNDHRIAILPVHEFKQRVSQVLKGHKHLIVGFNAYMKHYRIRLPIPADNQQQAHHSGKKRKIAVDHQLSMDLLDIIFTKILDFDDLFQFGSVCKNWWQLYKIYCKNFMTSQEPLLVQKSSISKKYFSLISLPHQKVYHSKMLNNFFRFAYQGSSSGYLIMTCRNNSFILINPFTRRKMKIKNSTFEVDFFCFSCYVLLAFVRGSKEFILVVSGRNFDFLHVYKSQNSGWVTYSTLQKIVDFVVLHNAIYIVTDKAKIGILNLNSADIHFLELKSTPNVTSAPYSHVRLVSCDGQLLVLNFNSKETFNVYKIDFSTMDYVKLETLGDLALFYAPRKKYYALSNPGLWGYEKNSVHVIDLPCHKYRVYKGEDNKMPEFILPYLILDLPSEASCQDEVSYKDEPYLDWCFRHLHYEVDYSFV